MFVVKSLSSASFLRSQASVVTALESIAMFCNAFVVDVDIALFKMELGLKNMKTRSKTHREKSTGTLQIAPSFH